MVGYEGKKDRSQKQKKGIPKQGISGEEGKGETLLKFWMGSRGGREDSSCFPLSLVAGQSRDALFSSFTSSYGYLH